ncbi:hypothetical protein MPTK1_4g08110 [Marchantia polymorpha subsp. ruderalis]
MFSRNVRIRLQLQWSTPIIVVLLGDCTASQRASRRLNQFSVNSPSTQGSSPRDSSRSLTSGFQPEGESMRRKKCDRGSRLVPQKTSTVE